MTISFMMLTANVGASGGRQLIYRVAEILDGAGHKCRVVYNVPNAKEPFGSSVRSAWVNDMLLEWQRGLPELVVIPEYVAGSITSNIPAHCDLIMFVQNAHVMHHQTMGDKPNPYLDERVKQIWVVSEHSRMLMSSLYPATRDKIRLLPADLMCETFPTPDPPLARGKKVLWLPRKTDMIELYDRGLRAITERNGYELVVLADVSRATVLQTMLECEVFVSTSMYESLPAPVLESMVSGCRVVGYCGTGEVVPEWMRKGMRIVHDPLSLFDALENELKFGGKTDGLSAAGAHIRKSYTADALKSRVLEVISEVL